MRSLRPMPGTSSSWTFGTPSSLCGYHVVEKPDPSRDDPGPRPAFSSGAPDSGPRARRWHRRISRVAGRRRRPAAERGDRRARALRVGARRVGRTGSARLVASGAGSRSRRSPRERDRATRDRGGRTLGPDARRRPSRRGRRRPAAGDHLVRPAHERRVSAAASAATGLAEGTPIVAGAGDQAAGAVGMGISRPGAVSATIGTSGVVFAATDRPATDPRGRLHTFCHAIPGRWHVMGVTQAAGLSLRWIRDRLCEGGGPTSYDALARDAEAVPPGADGVLWAPYLMGERTPHLDPDIRGALVGLAAHHTRAHIVRAVMEGVAFSLRDTLTIFQEMDVPVKRIRLGGGGARSPLWRRIQADVYGHAVETVAADEGAAYGAALLAGVGARIWQSVDEVCESLVHVADETRPDATAIRVMNERYAAFRALYPALRQVGSTT